LRGVARTRWWPGWPGREQTFFASDADWDLRPGRVLLAPLEEAIIARSRDCWHRHAEETSWHVFTPRDGDGPARW
jgi:hypothetical protein